MTDVVTPASPAASTARTLSPDKIMTIRKSAEEFEAMAIGQLLQPMFATVDTSKSLFGGGRAEQSWKPMLVDEMGKALAKRGGIGIASAVFNEMLRMQEAKHD